MDIADAHRDGPWMTAKERKLLNRLQQRMRDGDASREDIRQLILLKRKQDAR